MFDDAFGLHADKDLATLVSVASHSDTEARLLRSIAFSSLSHLCQNTRSLSHKSA